MERDVGLFDNFDHPRVVSGYRRTSLAPSLQIKHYPGSAMVEYL